MPEYRPIAYNNVIRVDELYTVHYFHFEPGHIPTPESHDFSELIYVDRNSASVCTPIMDFHLSHGEMILLEPGLAHGIRGDREVGPNIGLISFESSLADLGPLSNRVLVADAIECDLLRLIFHEGYASFGVQLDASHLKYLHILDSAPLGSVQMIRLYTEQLLIHMLRSHSAINTTHSKVGGSAVSTKDEAQHTVVEYMQQHLDGTLRFADLCAQSRMSSTALRSLFREEYGMTPMHYYHVLRIEESKRLLRHGSLNITEISERLGFSSPNYFSSCFKSHVGMTPTQYVSSIHP
jgi:AraC-like DNA-binding protein